MKVIAINGSPRKGWNTDKMLRSALNGAESQGAENKIIHLYDLNFKGCKSCLACKRIGIEHKCYIKDELTPVLEEVSNADAVIIGSPIYFMELTGVVHAFLERFCFPYTTYSTDPVTFFERKLPIGFIYTMNMKKEMESKHTIVNHFETFMKILFNVKPEIVCAYNTYQYTNYDKYEHGYFSVEDKTKHRDEEFPNELENARQLGINLVKKIGEINK